VRGRRRVRRLPHAHEARKKNEHDSSFDSSFKMEWHEGMNSLNAHLISFPRVALSDAPS
jgi:hypothetical protein